MKRTARVTAGAFQYEGHPLATAITQVMDRYRGETMQCPGKEDEEVIRATVSREIMIGTMHQEIPAIDEMKFDHTISSEESQEGKIIS